MYIYSMDIKDIQNENLITIMAFSKLKGITRPTVYDWIKKGKVKTVRVIDKDYVNLLSFKED